MSSCSLLLKRSLSTSAISRQLIKPPAQVHGIEGRYAAALYSAASKAQKLDAVEKDLKSVRKLFQTDIQFRDFMLDPTHKRNHKKQAIEAIVKKLGFSDTSLNFLVLVAENGKLKKLQAMIKSYEQIMSAHRGELFCSVITAKPLDAAMTKELNEALQSFAKSGQKLHVTTSVDPELLGGMIVNVGDKYVDMSLASKIKKYTSVLKSAV